MAMDDEAARKARAERLRAQIASSKKQDVAPAAPTAQAEPAKAESPREFVERKMREKREDEAGA